MKRFFVFLGAGERTATLMRAEVKAVGGRWFPEEHLWYVRYGAIAGGTLEKHIHVDNLDK